MKLSLPTLLLCLLLLAGLSSCKSQKATSSPASSSSESTEKPSQREFDFVIKNIEFEAQDEKKFLKLTFEDRSGKNEFYPYPLFRIESEGKVIAERGLTTYGLVEVELVPTTLNSLPENFTCTVFLSAHGSMGVPDFELHYPEK